MKKSALIMVGSEGGNMLNTPIKLLGMTQEKWKGIIRRVEETMDDEYWRNPNRKNKSWLVDYANRECCCCDISPYEGPLIKYPRTAKWSPNSNVNEEEWYCALCLMNSHRVIYNPKTKRYRKMTQAELIEYDIPYDGKDAKGFDWGY